MSNYVNLHTHSVYSEYDGLLSIKEIVNIAKKNGQHAQALTDHGNMRGVIEFYKECKKVEKDEKIIKKCPWTVNKLKPIIGMEGYICNDVKIKKMTGKDRGNRHILLLAKNNKGYQNLIKLSTIGFLDGFYFSPRFDFSILEKHSEGLICCAACLQGVIQQYILRGNNNEAIKYTKWFKDVFHDDFYLEVMSHGLHEQEKIIKAFILLSKKFDIPIVATNDSHYACSNDKKYQEIKICMVSNALLSSKEKIDSDDNVSSSNEFYMKSYEDMKKVFGENEDWLLKSCEISEKCELEIDLISQNPNTEIKLPKTQIIINDNIKNFKNKYYANRNDNVSYLAYLCWNGLKKRGDKYFNNKKYIDRLKYELDIILNKVPQFIDYFLILYDFVHHSKRIGNRVGVGRGSGVSSLILWCLEITGIDPLNELFCGKLGLPFWRFLNPDRVSPPDVDIDFANPDVVHAYLIDKYGADRFARIGTVNDMKLKGAFQRVGKTLDITKTGDSSENDKFVKVISKQMWGDKVQDALKNNPDLQKYYDKYKEIFDITDRFVGMFQNPGVHASGVIISSVPLTDIVPLFSSGAKNNKVICTQYDMNALEDLGLLKFDILGISTLLQFDLCLKMIKKRKNIDIDIDNLVPNDKNVLKMLDSGDSAGVFQFESPGMRKLLKSIGITHFKDMVAANALFRPGPLKNGMHDLYSKNKKNPKYITYEHQAMKPILDDTYGVFIYQEQMMQLSMDLAKFSMADADKLRKGMAKKHPEILKSLKEQFISGCLENKVDYNLANRIWDGLEKFGEYGFNRSHATAYAYIAYQTAYLKYYYPIEFYASFFSSDLNKGNTDDNIAKIIVNMEEAYNNKGIKFLPININKSGLNFRVEGDDSIRLPLSLLKGMPTKTMYSIVKNQPFESVEDFIKKVGLSELSIKVIDLLSNGEDINFEKCWDEYLHVWGQQAEENLRKFRKFVDYINKLKHNGFGDWNSEEVVNNINNEKRKREKNKRFVKNVSANFTESLF